MVSVVVTVHFQIVSKKMHDQLNSDLACGCNCSSRCALFKVTLNFQ